MLQSLSSMKTGLVLLLLLGAVAALGSLVPQGEQAEFYQIHYGELLGNFLLLLSFDRLYSSWWFILLGVIFAANILICSLQRMKGIQDIKSAGSVLLHVSILVIFIGSLLSGLVGKSEYIEIGTADTADLSSIGFPGYQLTVTDFKIDYYETLEPKQYISSLVLTNAQGNRVVEEISVNHPMKAEGLTIYQNSYGWLAKGRVAGGEGDKSFELINGDELELDHGITLKTIFIPDFDPISGTLHSRTPLPNNPHLACALLRGEQLLDVQVIPEGETSQVGSVAVTFEDYRYYTGLEIKRDPGVKVVYGGFVLMLLGLACRYLAPQKGRKVSEVAQ
ncbi:cytochrome c biogenesis protein ResB [Desulforamulus ferrireducens]|uniref:ResB-like domain-containing protein n=1 Tax=Desulforamulus ferrireducens TaxID=1833852 RepID=A0A1S6IW14_9FIRM|nr:cytochrome c biogenesis protein ResB [Desulforamulus ferrireducens]AQS58949.1 hypothetical protein B0537_07540 [Desulforamulus ferrireducens]